MKVLIISLIACIGLLVSCQSETNNGEVLAEVGSKKLYYSEVLELLHTDQSKEDSINVITDYARRWVQNQLIVNQAEKNLSKEDLDVQVELDNYRASLLIYKYQQAYIAQRMDTIVTEEMINEFYINQKDNFQLSSLLIKGLYIKISNSSKSIAKVRSLFRSNKEKDFADLERICSQERASFDAFDGQWADFAQVTKEMPLNTGNYENQAIKYRFLDEKDDNFTYFLTVKELLMKGGIAPLEHVREDIKSMVLNKRKVDLINQLEERILNDGTNNKEFHINIDQ